MCCFFLRQLDFNEKMIGLLYRGSWRGKRERERVKNSKKQRSKPENIVSDCIRHLNACASACLPTT